jgi:hypothetical protein
MDYIEADVYNDELRLKAKPGLQVYAIIAIPLIALTMTIYVAFELIQRETFQAKTKPPGSAVMYCSV